MTLFLIIGLCLIDVPDKDPAAGQLRVETHLLPVFDQEVLARARVAPVVRSIWIVKQLNGIIVGRPSHLRNRLSRVDVGQIVRGEPLQVPLAPRIVVRRGVGQVNRAAELRGHRAPPADALRAAVGVVQVGQAEGVAELVGKEAYGLDLVAHIVGNAVCHFGLDDVWVQIDSVSRFPASG